MTHTHSVLVYDFMPARIPFERGAKWMETAAPAALAAAAEGAFDNLEGGGRLELGEVRSRWDSLVLDVQLVGNEKAFGYLQGELQLAPLREAHSHLSLSAGYEPSRRSQLSAVERRIAQRETEVRVREFLSLVASELQRWCDEGM
jgi:hypothetical protein